MEDIIKPISKELLKAELTEDKRLRMTNKSNNQIYIITHLNAPNVMREIGRLREIAFRAAGGGTGLSMDIDEYDTMEHPYKQLIVWNPEAEEILGGYRYLLGTDVRFDEKGAPILATSHMFHFSDTFIKEYLPQTIELGRSFVTLEYQSTRAGSKGLFALDNLWDGLGALTVVMPNVKYFFGKVTMYPSYHRRGRDMILYVMIFLLPSCSSAFRSSGWKIMMRAVNTSWPIWLMIQVIVFKWSIAASRPLRLLSLNFPNDRRE